MASLQGMSLSKPFIWLVLAALSLISMVLAMLVGSSGLSFNAIWTCLVAECHQPLDAVILFEVRLPRVVGAFMAGAALAVAGSQLQTVTRNGLADPYLFGVVAGAGLGAALVSVLPLPEDAWLADVAMPVAAFVGSCVAVLIVQLMAVSAWGRSAEQLLLAGIAISLMLSALTHIVLYLGDPFAANKVMFWLMGSLARIQQDALWLMGLPLLLVVLIGWWLGPAMDALLMGDDTARSLGVSVDRLRLLGLLGCAALTAVVVSQCGGIGFVGLMIPHIVRRWLGVPTRIVLPGCLLLGGLFLVWADTAARSVVASQDIPIGIVTSAIGSVFFLLMMRQRGV